ncbi:MAG TPA: prenyltransferase/squalene oxidase repeat-containing protein [Bryobacteraceae bacterium]|jgi:hypothetical protein
MSIDILLHNQNQDGGWSYCSPRANRPIAANGSARSWTEATAYSVLALLAAGESRAAGRGLEWINSSQRPDGGWPPQAGIDESSWVTALVALIPPEKIGVAVHERAIGWLLSTYGQESSVSYRVRQFLLGNRRPADQLYPGWPWVPGAAAWVGPTSLAILALDKEYRLRPTGARAIEIRGRVESGRNFLLARMCTEGGWNHGSSRSAGYESRPYPETTGMALAALRGVASPKVDRALAVARAFLSDCRSADALNWLRLGLLAHGQLPEGSFPATPAEYRTLSEMSFALLVTGEGKGREFFWS